MTLAEDRDTIILEYHDIIEINARQLARRYNYRFAAEDLIGVGVLGLIQAIERYDNQRETTFRAFAEYSIQGAMWNEIRHLYFRPRHTGVDGRAPQETFPERVKALALDIEAASLVPSAEEIVEHNDLIDRLHVYLDGLPDNEKAVIHPYFWEDMNTREIAAQLCVPKTTVWRWLSSGIHRLRRLFQWEGLIDG